MVPSTWFFLCYKMTTRRRRGTVLAALVVAVIFIYVALLQGFNGHQNDAVKVTEALWEPEVATTQATIQPEFSEPVAMQPMPVSQPTRDLLQVIDPTAQAAKSSVVVNDQDDELEVEEEAAQQDAMIEVGASPQPADRVCIGSPAFNASELETVPQAVQCLLESPRFYPVLFGFSQQSETTTSLFNTFLEQGKFRLTIDRREVDITTPIDWHMNPFKDRTWQMWFHSWKELVGLPLFEYKSHPDRPELVRFAKVFALDWCEKFGATRPERFASIPKGKEGDPQFPIKAYLWYDMAVSSRATQLINLLRLGAHAGPDYLSETEFAALAACQLEHAYYLAANDTYAWYNHGLFSDMSLFFISRDLPWLHPNTTAWGDLAIYRFGANAGASIDVASGMHLEHSVSYQSAMINLLTVADEANVLGHTSLGADILQKMRRALVWMLTTDDEQSMPLVGDTSAEEFAHRAQYEHEDGLAPAIMNKGGAAIVKQLSTRSHLFMVAWFHSCTHKHADELSFVLTEFGRQLVVDLGKYAYHYAHPDRLHAVSPQAHNGVTVDVTPFTSCFEMGRPYRSAIRMTATQSGWSVLVGDNPVLAALQNISHTRTLLYRPGQLLVIIDHLVPDVGDDSEHAFTRYLHFAPEIALSTVQEQPATYEAHFETDSKERVLAAVVEDWSAGETQLELIKGQRKPTIQGWYYPWLLKSVPAYASELVARRRGETLFVTAMRMAGVGTSTAPPASLHKLQTGRLNPNAAVRYEVELELDNSRWQFKIEPSSGQFDVVPL